MFHGEKNGYNARKIKVASFVYYSVDSSSFRKHCKQSAEEKADWLLLKTLTQLVLNILIIVHYCLSLIFIALFSLSFHQRERITK